MRNLIALRKAHPAFRLSTQQQCSDVLSFLNNKKEGLPEKVLAWELNGLRCGDTWKSILIVANPEETEVSMNLKEGDWITVTDGQKFIEENERQIIGGGSTVTVLPKTVTVFARI